MKNLKAVDFFSSGGGMTYGLTKSGIQVIAGIDNDPQVKQTYELNNAGALFLEKDVFALKEIELQQLLKLEINDDNLIFVGCSPCQYWSVLSSDKTKSKKTKTLLSEFQRFILFFLPGYVIIENVPGLVHRADESGLTEFIDSLKVLGYTISAEVFNLSNYGVPQTRKRYSLIASRVNREKIYPKKSNSVVTVRDVLGEPNGFPSIHAGHVDLTNFQHTSARLSNENLETIRRTPINGGNSVKVRTENRKKGFEDSYSRMSWDKPAPTITTKFFSFSNGRFGHPEENRALSLREGATLQTFPRDYVFYANSITAIARMIGNAVPPEFAKRIGEAILDKSKT